MKSNFTVEQLGDHVKQVSVRNKAETDIEVFSVTNSEGFTRSTDYFSKEVFSKDVSNYKIVRRKQFAYNPSRINVGSIDYLRDEDKVIISPLYIVFETDSNVYEDYLFRFLKSDWGNLQIRANTEGAVRDSLKYKGLEKIKIPLPPLDDQKRIAHLLGKVEGMISRRKRHLEELDELLKSVFLEMFGDPVRNEKGWEFTELENFGDVSTGNTPPRKDPVNYTPGHLEWIKTDNIPADSATITEAQEMLSEKGAEKGRIVEKGALLVACIAGSVESIGRAALSDRTVAFNQQINAIQPYDDVNSLFLYALFKICKKYVQSHATKGMKKILTKGDFVKIKMIKPPIESQNQFASVIEKVESLKSRYQSSLSNLENLYGALSQKAFKGELDLSKIPIPDDMSEESEEVPMRPFDEGLSEAAERALADLNSFNNSSSAAMRALEAIKLDSPAIKAAQLLAEQASLWKSPLDELKNMSSISRAMEELAKPSALQQLAAEQLEAFRSTSAMAQQIAASLPKIDMSWMEMHKELLESTTRPFAEMQKALAGIDLSKSALSTAMAGYNSLADRFDKTIPDYASWQQHYRDPESVEIDDEDESEPKHIFTSYDILDALKDESGLSFDELSKKLSALEVIDLSAYERIKAILFDLLREGALDQIVVEKENTDGKTVSRVQLRLAE